MAEEKGEEYADELQALAVAAEDHTKDRSRCIAGVVVVFKSFEIAILCCRVDS